MKNVDIFEVIKKENLSYLASSVLGRIVKFYQIKSNEYDDLEKFERMNDVYQDILVIKKMYPDAVDLAFAVYNKYWGA